MSEKKKASTADKFSQLFDQDWSNTKSRIRTQQENRRTYDISNSWDARSDNPQEFSRLDQTLVPFQKSRPIVLSGNCVVQLEENTGYDTLNIKMPNFKSTSHIPLTVQQKDTGMTNDLTGQIPILDHTVSSSNQILVMDKRPGFENNNLSAPTLKAVAPPEYFHQAGKEVDGKLLNPKQRREVYRLIQQGEDAKQLVNAAQRDRNKTRNLINGAVYHRGIMMCDSNDNVHSEIYGERARRDQADREYKQQIGLERQSNLCKKTSSILVNGNILCPESLGPRVKLEKDFQSKGGDRHGFSFEETHNRLFCRLQGAYGNTRTQELRDIELSGKDYNIVNHTMIEQWPPRQFERQYEKSMGHPSQQALEHSRNLQGTLRPY